MTEAGERLDTLAGQADLPSLTDGLFAMVAILDREHALRRSLADPARPGEQKADVVRVLLEGKVSAETLDMVSGLARSRWSRPGDLVDAMELLAVAAEAAHAEQAGQLDDVEDELFRFGRITEANPRLRAVLADPGAAPEGKAELLSSLLAERATASTVRLLTFLTHHLRGRTLERGLEAYGGAVAQRRRRLVALVRTALPLTDQQRSRLAAALAGTYGREVALNVEIDPAVLGGLSVQVADEVIDGTVAGRMDRLRRQLGR